MPATAAVTTPFTVLRRELEMPETTRLVVLAVVAVIAVVEA